MKVKLLTDGGFMGISCATNFQWDTLFEATLGDDGTSVEISMEDLIDAGYDLISANGGCDIPADYVITGRTRNFFLDTHEAVIVEE